MNQHNTTIHNLLREIIKNKQSTNSVQQRSETIKENILLTLNKIKDIENPLIDNIDLLKECEFILRPPLNMNDVFTELAEITKDSREKTQYLLEVIKTNYNTNLNTDLVNCIRQYDPSIHNSKSHTLNMISKESLPQTTLRISLEPIATQSSRKTYNQVFAILQTYLEYLTEDTYQKNKDNFITKPIIESRQINKKIVLHYDDIEISMRYHEILIHTIHQDNLKPVDDIKQKAQRVVTNTIYPSIASNDQRQIINYLYNAALNRKKEDFIDTINSFIEYHTLNNLTSRTSKRKSGKHHQQPTLTK